MRTHFTSAIRSWSSPERVRILVIAAVIGASLLVGSLTWCAGHHVVKTDKGLVVVSKRFMSLGGTFADIRKWTWNDAVAHSELSKALVHAGYGDLLPKPPTAMEKASAKMREWRDEAVTASTNAWQQVKAKYRKTNTGDQK